MRVEKTRISLLSRYRSEPNHVLLFPSVGTPRKTNSRLNTENDTLRVLISSFLLYLLLPSYCSSTCCSFVTFFKFRFHFYYFLRIAPFYFLLIYIDKNNTHLMDDDFLCFSLYTTQLIFVAFFFTSSSCSNQYALIRCFCFF